MTLDELKARLREGAAATDDFDERHLDAENWLLDYIDDDEVWELFNECGGAINGEKVAA